LSFAVGFFIVHAAIGLAFEQRRQMFRTLRAMGLPALSLMLLLATELLALALLAGIAGVALGYGVAALLLPDVAASLRGLYGAEVAGTLSIRPGVWLAGIAIAVAGTLASAAGNLWQVWRMPLLASARPRAWAIASETPVRLQGIAAIALMLAAVLLAQYGRGLAAGFALLGALLLGSALILPLLLTAILKIAQRLSHSALGQWFWADTRQQLPGLSLTLMALMLALATNIGVGTMVSSFRLTFTGWLNQRLASELYVRARNQTEADAIHDWLVPRTDAVLPSWNVEGRVAGQPALIYGFQDHATYRDNWPLLESTPGMWDDIAAGHAAMINEQLARRAQLSLGDELTLPGGKKLAVGGVFSDYGNPKGQVMIASDLLLRLYPQVSRLRYSVRVSPAKAAALAQELRDRFHLPPEAVIDQAGIKAFSLRVFERTFAVTAALNILTLGIAGLAMLASLLSLSAMRLPQLAPVWAMGLTRARLARLELLRSLALAALTMVLSLPVGLSLAWALLAVVNVEAFGWRLPLHVFPAEWLRLALLAFLAAGLAALLPALRLARMAPAELLKVFAHER
jgi:putative ABC transport system permease protein